MLPKAFGLRISDRIYNKINKKRRKVFETFGYKSTDLLWIREMGREFVRLLKNCLVWNGSIGHGLIYVKFIFIKENY